MASNILRIDCPDEKGLIHKITGVLYKKGLNIISNHEFVEKNKNVFFMRSEFSGESDPQQILEHLLEILPKGANAKITTQGRKNIVVLVTKEHHCLGDLLMRNHFNELEINILAVISNHEKLKDLTLKFNIPFHYIPHGELSREEHESYLLKIIDPLNPDYLVLAKYMRVLTPEFISKFENRIINIHHSFLPAFKGASPYKQAYDRGVKIIGATAHFVNNDLDEGPIIAQSTIPVVHSHSASDMAKAGADVEKIVLARSLKLVMEERVFVSGNKTIIFD